MWEFWVDVGGTFTDCLGRCPDGQLVRHKTLSSGTTKGRCSIGSSTHEIHDTQRRGDPDDFYAGWRLRLLDEQGHVAASSDVEQFHSQGGSLRLAAPLPAPPTSGQRYELQAPWEAPIVAVRYLLRLPATDSLPDLTLRLGTTRGTNALLTRQGATTGLVTTEGFADVLAIGYQTRPELFQLAVRKPAPLYAAVTTVGERIAADGTVIRSLNKEDAARGLRAMHERGIESIAVVLVNSYANDVHERQILSICRAIGFSEISISSSVAPLIQIVPRGETTVVNAYLNPVLRTYLKRIASELPPSSLRRFRVMTSAGGLVVADAFQGKDSILSGPAGGVVGFAQAARATGFRRAIGFDMGGTSTDVSRFDGHYQYEFETEKAGVHVVAPMLAVETVAAGGGSICDFDGVKLTVGPPSAGAEPGPACYGRGGPLTVTDLNLLAGRLLGERFPFPLDRDAAIARRQELLTRVNASLDADAAIDENRLTLGLLRIANANMAQAIRQVSVAQGYDVREYPLVAFGGAAAQHACAVARDLAMRHVLVPTDAGILSAQGIGHAPLARHAAEGLYRPLDSQNLLQAITIRDALVDRLQRQLVDDGGQHPFIVRWHLDLRYAGTDMPLTVATGRSQLLASPKGDRATSDGGVARWRRAFLREHRRRFGYIHPRRPLEIVAVRVEVSEPPSPTHRSRRTASRRRPTAQFSTQMLTPSGPVAASCFDRERLAPGDVVVGPAIISEAHAVTTVDPAWTAEVLSGQELLIADTQRSDNRPSARCQPAGTSAGDTRLPTADRSPDRPRPERADPVQLEVFYRHFQSIASQMGSTLRNTASSVNVKQRLDFSCALFTKSGDLVANAPHVPVHLGAMSRTAKALLTDHPNLQSGDVLITNDPYRGGSHLPDVTVMTPIFDPSGSQLRFLVANRAHHAEIGGITPGSMPPMSRRLAEEGILIRSFRVVRAGKPDLDRLQTILAQPPYPSRAVNTNLADVRAQIAANQQGVNDLEALIHRYGWPTVEAYMEFIQQAAEQKMRHALQRIPSGRYQFADSMDDGSPIAVSIDIGNGTATVDFHGSAGVHPGNLNANPAIVTAAVVYVMRCLIAEPIPLNDGLLRPLKLIIPPGILDPPGHRDPARCPATVGGNVETSQRIVDVLLGALQLAAASQGTMNNLLFGDDSLGYYETICGGAGATADGPGADAVHTHMTNTRLTDVEVLERQYPVRLLEFSIRSDSAGQGEQRGGEGVRRELLFLRPLQVSILSQRRGPYPPYGLHGGSPGGLGRNRLRRAGTTSNEQMSLPCCCQFEALPGDRLIIETPGGGGYGRSRQGSVTTEKVPAAPACPDNH